MSTDNFTQEIGANMVLIELGGRDVSAATFDAVMETLVAAPAGVPIDLVFRDPSSGAAAESEAAMPAPPAVAMGVPCEITVVGGATLKAKTGDNLRKTLLSGKVEVYDMVGKVGARLGWRRASKRELPVSRLRLRRRRRRHRRPQTTAGAGIAIPTTQNRCMKRGRPDAQPKDMATKP